MNKSSKKTGPVNYEAKVAKIEEIIQKIETGNLEMTEMFNSFTLASQYLHECEDFLTEKQQQLTISVETLAEELDF
ncbi:exodeoxyribonuclease VII small subunit [Ancylothrix sp. C2]|uniref:exodeoxyribonuclease VII small subunit n=1 Tax=Ancylothrix sp. D3o TaxID=2953691 RepID=UPI0021BAB2C6|nr:exodeoxyribonuclease VII small subunit [Ancylothrix sp. D3o]MCT7948374.1 exodeoxyribonuclease VII small subunit [Ancylothrix sp. D3o]